MGNPNLKRHSPRGLVNHGPGKGDKPRHKLDDSWRANYDAIDWGHKPVCARCSDYPGGYLHRFFKAHYNPDLDTKSQ